MVVGGGIRSGRSLLSMPGEKCMPPSSSRKACRRVSFSQPECLRTSLCRRRALMKVWISWQAALGKDEHEG